MWKLLSNPRPLATTALLLATVALCAQNEEQRLRFSDPSAPGRVEISLTTGKIDVEGYDGSEVIVRASGPAAAKQQRPARQERDGLRRVGGGGWSYTLEEQGGVVRLKNTPPMAGRLDLHVRMPRGAALKIRCMSCEVLRVQKLNGGIDIENMSGLTEALNVAGALNVHALSGDVKVSLTSVEADSATAISAMRGDIDMALPASAKATFSISNLSGDVFTDLDLELQEKVRRTGNWRSEQATGQRSYVGGDLQGDLNGGGARIQLRNYKGDILIRQQP
jgi:hypothetical protein